MNSLLISFLSITLAPFGAIALGEIGVGLTESMAIGTVVALVGIAFADFHGRASRDNRSLAHASIMAGASSTRQPSPVAVPGVTRCRQHAAALEVC
jgi:hypothetical protein